MQQMFGDATGRFLTPQESLLLSRQHNAPLGFSDYGGIERYPFQHSSGDLGYLSPSHPPVNVLQNPIKYNVGQNIRDILGGNNRSDFSPQTINQVQQFAGTQAPMSPSDHLLMQIIRKLQTQNNQGFIKTPPGGQY